jgi:hypothetical protein
MFAGRVLFAGIVFLTLRADYESFELKGDSVRYRMKLRLRPFSPFFWLLVVLLLPLSLLRGGLVDFLRGVGRQLAGADNPVVHQFQGNFKPSIPYWQRRLQLFVQVYTS